MLFKRILLATDFSEPARQLIQCLPELKAMGMEEVVLFHAISVVKAQASALELKQYNEEELEKEKNRLEEQGLKVSVKVPLGFAPQEIIHAAKEEKASMILMGSHGGGMIKSIFLGSTTFDVIRMSEIPVLVEKYKNVKADDYRSACELKFDKILFPTDFSPCSRLGYEQLKELAPKAQRIELVSVLERISDQSVWEEAKDRSEQEMLLMKKELEALGTETKIHVTQGTPSRQILEIADRENVSLILISRRGQGKIKDLLLGSTAEAVARQSKQPVLLVPCIF